MKILVVIDMQNDFLHGALKNEEGVKIIPGVIEKIKEYLLASDKSLVEISDKLHFDNTAYLCRFFKKHTGVTQNTYRNAQKTPFTT